MGTQTQDTSRKVHAEHMDGSTCEHPELCGLTGTVFIFGGRADHVDALGDE